MFLKEIPFTKLFCQGNRISTRRQFVVPVVNSLNLWTSPVFRQTHSASSQAESESMDAADNREGEEKSKEEGSFSSMFHRQSKTQNLRLTEDSTPYCSKVIHPGLPLEFYDRNGNQPLSSLLRTLSMCRIFALHTPADENGRTLFEYDRITADSMTFISSSLINVSSSMYDPSIPKWPLQVKVEGGHIGRTSISFVTSMSSLGDPERKELISQISQVVKVDRSTRRPTPFEDEWRNAYQSKCVRGEPLIIKRQGEPASGPLNIYEMKIAWSDTDSYAHTNFSSYARFVVDAIYDTLKQGKLDGILTQADLSLGVSQLKSAYLGESEDGDILKIKVWQVEDSERTLLCSMEKDGQVINQMAVSFHSPAN